MDFNKKILKPINKKGALKSYNDKGVKVDFESKSDGHTFSGELDGKGKGKLTYKGKWMGFGFEENFHTDGKHETKFSRKRTIGGKDFNFKLGYKHGKNGIFNGDLDFSFDTAFSRTMFGGKNDFSVKAETKFKLG